MGQLQNFAFFATLFVACPSGEVMAGAIGTQVITRGLSFEFDSMPQCHSGKDFGLARTTRTTNFGARVRPPDR